MYAGEHIFGDIEEGFVVPPYDEWEAQETDDDPEDFGDEE